MVIAIVGPTAVGKTKMSVSLAKLLDGEIINADSTQVYIGMDIATAKVTEQEKEMIPHHLFDFKDMKEDYTVYDYQKDCRKKIEEILSRGKVPILVGGTGLYLKAALYDYQFVEESLKEQYDNLETTTLYEQLKKIDPNTKIHPNNRKRIVRALNYYYETNQIPSEKKKTETLLYPTCFIGLTTDRELLYKKINQRVDQMVEQGLIEEARYFYNSRVRSKAVLTPIGYKELFSYFDGVKTLEEAIEDIKQHSRRYAKRQYTWFYHQIPVNWFSVNFENFESTIEQVKDFLMEKID